MGLFEPQQFALSANAFQDIGGIRVTGGEDPFRIGLAQNGARLIAVQMFELLLILNTGDDLMTSRTQHRDAIVQPGQRLQRVQLVVDQLGALLRVARKQPQNEQIHPHRDQRLQGVPGIGVGRDKYPAFRVSRPFANAEWGRPSATVGIIQSGSPASASVPKTPARCCGELAGNVYWWIVPWTRRSISGIVRNPGAERFGIGPELIEQVGAETHGPLIEDIGGRIAHDRRRKQGCHDGLVGGEVVTFARNVPISAAVIGRD